MKDLNGAFPRTPEAIEEAIRAGIRRGRRRQMLRARLRQAVAVAAVLAVAVGVFSLAVHRDHLGGPNGKNNQAMKGPSASQSASPSPLPTALFVEASEEAAPLPSPEAAETTTAPLFTALPAGGSPETSASAVATPTPSEPARSEAPVEVTPEPTELSLSLTESVASLPAADAVLDEYLAEDLLDTLYYYSTDKGMHFHTASTCTNMQGAQLRTLREALELGQDFCPNCIGAELARTEGDLAWCPVGDGYYHGDRGCAGVGDAIEDVESALTTVERARILGKAPCPDCVTRRQVVPAVLDGALYCTAGGTYVHTVPNCTNMQGASACTLSQALASGKILCPTCIGSRCIYVNGIYWNSQTCQLLVSLDMAAATDGSITAGSRLDLSAMERAEGGINAWDEWTLAAAMTSGIYADIMESIGAARVDVCDVDVTLDGWNSMAKTEWVDEGGRHLCLIYDGVTEDRLSELKFSVNVSARYYCDCDEGLFVYSQPAVAAEIAPLGYNLSYYYDNDGSCAAFTPGMMLGEYNWTDGWAYGNAMDAFFVPVEGAQEVQISAYQVDAAINGADMAILEVRTGAGMTIAGVPASSTQRVTMSMRAEGDELVYTAIVTMETAEEVLKDPSVLGFAYTDASKGMNASASAADGETSALDGVEAYAGDGPAATEEPSAATSGDEAAPLQSARAIGMAASAA